MSAHTNCTHPATKSARAACRKLTASTITVPANIDNPAEYRRIATLIQADDMKVTPGLKIDRSCWKGYRHAVIRFTIETLGVQGDDTREGKIVYWGEKFMAYQSATGHNTRVPVERIRDARTV